MAGFDGQREPPLLPQGQGPTVPVRLAGEAAIPGAGLRGSGPIPGAAGPNWLVIKQRIRMSPRGLQIVQGIFAGEKQAQIAARLGITLSAVEEYWKRVRW